ncbi:MAG TPA: asparagine synthase (glutamine-hydrolyzing), partial [Tepidisphaeraceae bacterium]
MCGIAGYIQRRPPPQGTIDRMIERLAHRGPDGSGIWYGQHLDWHIALGHRRLAIIDVAAGRQPLGNEDGSVQITYNGELYNFQSLRRQLTSQGHRFATRCDTEVIVHHHEQHGEAGLSALNGMFAFAVWDGRGGRLILVRDRIGIKPLYYAQLPDGGIAFASELTALLAHPEIDRSIDPDGLARYFFLDYVHPPHTIVRGARKLEPGHSLVWTSDGISPPRRFWNLSATSFAPEQEEHLLDTLEAAVEAQLVSDVPIGVFLSG